MADNQQEKARAFKELNDRGELLLPNAWDGASARIFEEAGFPAIGTTSAGTSYSRGLRDGENLDRSLAIHHLAAIAQAMHLEGTWNEVEQSFFGFVEAEALFAKDGD